MECSQAQRTASPTGSAHTLMEPKWQHAYLQLPVPQKEHRERGFQSIWLEGSALTVQKQQRKIHEFIIMQMWQRKQGTVGLLHPNVGKSACR